MQTLTRPHYVKHNAVTRVPRSYIYLDTEAHRTVGPRRELQTFRLATAAYDTKRHHGDGWKDREWFRSTSPDGLWRWIDSKCRTKARTVLVAHNLAYDLRISKAFELLPALGWSFRAGRVDDGQAWMMFRNAGRTLFMVDTLSWVPTSLEALGELVGLAKVPLPDWEDDDAAWFARCDRDVEILAEVWRRLMAWVEVDDLGNWKPSGAGQSWGAFRHRFMAYPLLVHADDDARAAERHAAHTGRCEAWRVGKLTGGPYTEWDFTTAYARIGAECDLPVQLCGEVVRPDLATMLDAPANRAYLIECSVTTDVPTVPRRGDTGISWPVGTFATTLWSSEVALAVAAGAHVDVSRAWVYRCAPALAPFCTWVLDGLEGRRGVVDPVVRVALKHWSRAIIGRTAAQWSRWEPWGTAPHADVALAKVTDVGAGEDYQLLQLGHQWIRQVGAPDNPDAMVAIMSWVMAESRVRLWDAMQRAGIENVVYVDTDSLIVSERGSARLASAEISGLRIKGRWADLEVLGPRQLIPGARLRAAGVPRGAVRIGTDTWEAEVWSGLRRSIREGTPSAVAVERRTFRLRGTDNRRIHHKDGSTSPVRLAGPEVTARIGA